MDRDSDHPQLRPRRKGSQTRHKRKERLSKNYRPEGGEFGDGWGVSSPPWPRTVEKDGHGKSSSIWPKRLWVTRG